MRVILFLTFIFITLCVQLCQSSNILVMFPSPSRSQIVIMQTLTKELARRGHEITFVSPFPLEKPIKNHRDIKVEITDIRKDLVLKLMSDSAKKSAMLKNFPSMIDGCAKSANESLNIPEFKKIMKEESFDLVMIGFFFNHFLVGLGDHFKCPTMLLSTAGTLNIVYKLNGNPLDPSSVPHLMAPYKKTMTFPQRLKTFFLYSVDFLMAKYVDRVMEKFYNFNFPPEKYKSLDEMKRNISLILFNDHYSQGGVKPLLPNSVEVGGIQIKTKPSPLPKNIQEFLDGAEHGAIFFSLGSNAKSTFMPKEKVDLFMKAFGKLKQRVIFKWEADSLPGQPSNVLTGKWLPQDDILAHPNLKIFISHCGFGSLVESKYHAVPIVAMPLFGDQMSNAEKIVEEGWATKISFSKLNEEDLLKAINEVLTNSTYKNNVQNLANLYKDRPQTALETAVFWVEYVLRHRGAPHMHYAGADLNFLQRNSIDVIAFFIFVIFVVFKIATLTFRCTMNFLIKTLKNFRSNSKSSKSKKIKKS